MKEGTYSLNSSPALHFTFFREITGVKSQHDLSTNDSHSLDEKVYISKNSKALLILWENICEVCVGKTVGA